MKTFWCSKRFFVPLLACFIISFAEEGFGAGRVKVAVTARYTSDKEKDDGEENVDTDKKISESSWVSETEVGTLTMTLKNSGDEAVTGDLVWGLITEKYSLTQKSSSSTQEEPKVAVDIFDPGRKEITLAPGESVTEAITLSPLESKTTNRTDENVKTGNVTETEIVENNVYKGFVVTFIVDNSPVELLSNSSRYKKNSWALKCVRATKKAAAPSKAAGRAKPKPLY